MGIELIYYQLLPLTCLNHDDLSSQPVAVATIVVVVVVVTDVVYFYALTKVLGSSTTGRPEW